MGDLLPRRAVRVDILHAAQTQPGGNDQALDASKIPRWKDRRLAEFKVKLFFDRLS